MKIDGSCVIIIMLILLIGCTLLGRKKPLIESMTGNHTNVTCDTDSDSDSDTDSDSDSDSDNNFDYSGSYYSTIQNKNSSLMPSNDDSYNSKKKHKNSHKHQKSSNVSLVGGSNSANSMVSQVNRFNAKHNNGVPASQIPSGQEDLYILKSEIVPPVCPACPAVTACPTGKNKCPPCPACERCPEPAFECKKVPNYNSINSNQLPRPILNSFSQFGM